MQLARREKSEKLIQSVDISESVKNTCQLSLRGVYINLNISVKDGVLIAAVAGVIGADVMKM